MKKYFSKIVSLSLILAVSWAGVFCCQLFKTPLAEASDSSAALPNTGQAMPSCHAKKEGKTSTPVQSDCGCCAAKQLQTNASPRISLFIPQTTIEYVLLNVFFQPLASFKEKFDLAYLNGPPKSASDTPLYISLRNLRL